MKINKITILISFLIFFFSGFFLGMYFKNTKNTVNPVNPIDIKPLSKSCSYNGKTYKSGEGFPSEDGCNSCSCVNGQVACTLMFCE